MIYITGDIHAHLDDKRREIISKFQKDDILLVLGDLGYSFSESILESAEFPCKVLSVLGNHENYSLIKTKPIEEQFGARCYKLKEGIYHIMNGEVLTIEGLRFFCFGGALSIDKSLRIPYVSWWPEEIPSPEDFRNAINNLEKINFDVDFFLAHNCPADVKQRFFHHPYDYQDPTEKQLAELEFQIKFNNPDKNYKYMFGHHHRFMMDDKYTCLYSQMMVLESKKKRFVPLL